MKSDSLGPTAATKSKPGTTDSSRAKTSSPAKKKPPSTTKAVLNGSVGPTVRRENSTANGTTGKSLQDKSAAPHARPRAAPIGVTGATSKAKASKTTSSGKDSTHISSSDSPGNAQCSQTTPSTSGSVSPESSVSSPRNSSSQGLTMITFLPDSHLSSVWLLLIRVLESSVITVTISIPSHVNLWALEPGRSSRKSQWNKISDMVHYNKIKIWAWLISDVCHQYWY